MKIIHFVFVHLPLLAASVIAAPASTKRVAVAYGDEKYVQLSQKEKRAPEMDGDAYYMQWREKEKRVPEMDGDAYYMQWKEKQKEKRSELDAERAV